MHILTKLTHGLEICKLSDKDIDPAELFCRDICRQLLGVPQNTATPAVYFLFGILPVKAEVHKKAFGLFHNIASRPTSRDYQVALRQLSLKDSISDSWYVYIQKVLNIYTLPSAHEILANPPGKSRWKTLVKSSITLYWQTKMREAALSYRSLRWMSLTTMTAGRAPLIWTSSAYSVFETAKASIKCRLLSGTYILRASYKNFNQYEVNRTCLLCECEEEDIKHFLTACAALQTVRDRHMSRLSDVALDEHLRQRVEAEDDTLVQLLLDCQTLIPGENKTEIVDSIERISRDYILAIHKEREKRLRAVNNKQSR